MKKISVIFKEASLNRIKNNVQKSNSFLIIKYSGLSSADLCNLRMSLRAAQAELFVVKNAIARRALKDICPEDVIKGIDGPCGLVFLKDEPVNPSKVLYDFYKGNEKLKLEGGFLVDKPLSTKDIENIAKLPSKDMLRAQVVGALKSPLSGMVSVLKGNLRKLVYCLEQIKGKKQ